MSTKKKVMDLFGEICEVFSGSGRNSVRCKGGASGDTSSSETDRTGARCDWQIFSHSQTAFGANSTTLKWTLVENNTRISVSCWSITNFLGLSI